MFVGVISYLPDDEIKRNARIEMMHAGMESLRKVFKDEEIHINAQNYKRGNYIKGLDYVIKNKQGVGCSPARNQLLDIFYESDENFCILVDDDTILRDTSCAKYLFKLLTEDDDKVKGIDAISGKDIEIDPRVIVNTGVLTFDYMPFLNLNGLVILRNFNKFYGEKPYYVDIPCEDDYFRIDQLTKYKSFYCKELVYEGKISGKTSTLGDWENMEDQIAYYNNSLRKIYEDFKVPATDDGWFDFFKYPQVEVTPFSVINEDDPNGVYMTAPLKTLDVRPKEDYKSIKERLKDKEIFNVRLSGNRSRTIRGSLFKDMGGKE